MLCHILESLINKPLYFAALIFVLMCVGPGFVIAAIPMLINPIFNQRYRRQAYYALILMAIGVANIRLTVWIFRSGESWYEKMCL